MDGKIRHDTDTDIDVLLPTTTQHHVINFKDPQNEMKVSVSVNVTPCAQLTTLQSRQTMTATSI
jgi:hypothetical protein